MAFFEDLGIKVSQPGQEALKKTKIMAEITRINSQIAAEKRLIADNVNKIGEKYYELYCDSPDARLAPYVDAIKEAHRKIEDFEDQINRLKGVESCPKCGAELKACTLFCSACGTRIEQPQAEGEPANAAARFCAACGTPLGDGMRFCGNCGAKSE
jgi:hypothetical protein